VGASSQKLSSRPGSRESRPSTEPAAPGPIPAVAFVGTAPPEPRQKQSSASRRSARVRSPLLTPGPIDTPTTPATRADGRPHAPGGPGPRRAAGRHLYAPAREATSGHQADRATSRVSRAERGLWYDATGCRESSNRLIAPIRPNTALDETSEEGRSGAASRLRRRCGGQSRLRGSDANEHFAKTGYMAIPTYAATVGA
jgi:hypothetical protein